MRDWIRIRFRITTRSIAISPETTKAYALDGSYASVHEALVASPKVWQMICPRPDHWHVMAGPIVVRGQLVGAVGCTRDRSMSAFDMQNLTDLSGVCLHLSGWAATVRLQPIAPQPVKIARLTARELQVAELVALGRTNAEIGKYEHHVFVNRSKYYDNVRLARPRNLLKTLSASDPAT